MTTIIILRHGESEANLNKCLAGQLNVPLTDLGRRQAEIAAEFLKERHFDIIYSSPLSRAYETALPIAREHGMEIITDHDLCETSFGEWEGKSIDSMRENYTKWRNDYDCRPPQGESTREVRDRFGKALDRIAAENEGKTVLVASHGGCIRLLPSYYENDLDLIGKTPIASNVSITTVVYDNGVGRVEVYADDGYLGELKTYFDNGN
ncbi:MAG: histidine phosphatase family protein [Clostridia bacterium]|nr:histidine phosphatase family protein [Clostridia bacterium]